MQTRPLHIILCAALVYSCISCRNYRLQSEYRNTLLINQHLIVNDTIRTYHLFNPYKKANSPIIFLFHGNGGSADNIAGLSNVKAPYIPWFDIASKEGLILVIPDGTMGPKNSKGWNDCRNDASRIPNSDDVGFIKNLLVDIDMQSLLKNSSAEIA